MTNIQQPAQVKGRLLKNAKTWIKTEFGHYGFKQFVDLSSPEEQDFWISEKLIQPNGILAVDTRICT